MLRRCWIGLYLLVGLAVARTLVQFIDNGRAYVEEHARRDNEVVMWLQPKCLQNVLWR